MDEIETTKEKDTMIFNNSIRVPSFIIEIGDCQSVDVHFASRCIKFDRRTCHGSSRSEITMEQGAGGRGDSSG